MTPRPIMEATFECRCVYCDGLIFVGDEIGLLEPGGEWCHLECAEEEPWEEE